MAFWFLCGWLVRAAFLWHGAAIYRLDSGKALGAAFIHGWTLDLSTAVFLSFFSTFLLLVIPLAQLRKKILNALFWILGFLFFLIALADAELMLNWGNRINEQALQYMEHPQEAAAASAGAPFGSIALKLLLGLALARLLYQAINLALPVLPRKPHGRFLLMAWTANLILSALILRGGTGAVPLNQSSVAYSNETRLNILAVQA